MARLDPPNENELRRKRKALLIQIAAVEDWLGLDRTIPCLQVPPVDAIPDIADEDRDFWIRSRRAWMQEAAAIAQYLRPPKTNGNGRHAHDPRRSHGADPRRAHGG